MPFPGAAKCQRHCPCCNACCRRYVYEVAEMGRAADTSSLMATYGIILSNCMLPRFAGTAICAEVPRYQVR